MLAPDSNNKCRGFTLIELMIVVSIIGILSTLAVLQYQSYTIRSRVSEVLNTASSVKITMGEAFLSDGAFPAAADAIVGDMRSAFLNTSYIAAPADAVYAAGNPATWQVTLSAIGAGADGETLIFSFTGNASGVEMSCTGGTLNTRYRPAECRP